MEQRFAESRWVCPEPMTLQQQRASIFKEIEILQDRVWSRMTTILFVLFSSFEVSMCTLFTQRAVIS